jgi:enediyne biosynthesis thioesterase
VKPHYEHVHVVTLDETNAVGNVYFVSHLHWQGHCRELFLHERAPSVVDALARDLVLVTTRCACEYFAELAPFDRIVVRMTLDEIRQNRIAMRFDYLRDSNGGLELVARGEQEVACLRRSGGAVEPVPIPDELRRALLPYGGGAAPATAVRAP